MTSLSARGCVSAPDARFGPARLDRLCSRSRPPGGVGSGGPRVGEVVPAEGRRLQEDGVAGVPGGAGVGAAGMGRWETEEDQRKGLSAELWEREEAKGGPRGVGGAHGSQGFGGEPVVSEAEGTPRAPPGALREIYGASLCLFALA